MTVASTYQPVTYVGNGTTRAFAFPYAFQQPSDLVVALYDTVALAAVTPAPVLDGGGTYDFFVTATQDGRTGEYSAATVTLNNAPPGNYMIGLTRATSMLQTTEFLNAGSLPSDVIETALDGCVLVAQEAAASVASAVRVPITDPPMAPLPPAAQRANQWAYWDLNGNLTAGAALPAGTVTVSAAMAPVIAASTTAAALAAAGAASAAALTSEIARAEAAETMFATAHDVTASRAFNTIYTNTTGKVMMLTVCAVTTSAIAITIGVIVEGIQEVLELTTAIGVDKSVHAIVPPGNSYQVNISASFNLVKWTETW